MLNLFLSYLACSLPQGLPTIWAPILLVVSTIAYPAYDFYRLSQALGKEGAPDDPRLCVPKLSGYGLEAELCSFPCPLATGGPFAAAAYDGMALSHLQR